MTALNTTLSLAVVSGKGGVGKTNIALNLGFALHELGHSLVLLDGDLGLANLDVLLGISPEKNLQDLLGEAPLESVVVPLAQDFAFLPSAWVLAVKTMVVWAKAESPRLIAETAQIKVQRSVRSFMSAKRL